MAHKLPESAKADLIRGLKKQLAKAQTAIRAEKDAAVAREQARASPATPTRAAVPETVEFRKKEKMSARLHRTGVMMPPEPDSPMPEGHYMRDSITDTPNVQTQAPKAVHPVSAEHARACLDATQPACRNGRRRYGPSSKTRGAKGQ